MGFKKKDQKGRGNEEGYMDKMELDLGHTEMEENSIPGGRKRIGKDVEVAKPWAQMEGSYRVLTGNPGSSGTSSGPVTHQRQSRPD